VIGVSADLLIYATLDVASDLNFGQVLGPPGIGISSLDAAEGVPAGYRRLIAVSVPHEICTSDLS